MVEIKCIQHVKLLLHVAMGQVKKLLPFCVDLGCRGVKGPPCLTGQESAGPIQKGQRTFFNVVPVKAPLHSSG